MKNKLPLLLIPIFIILGIGLVVAISQKKPAEQTQATPAPKKKVSKPLNVIPAEERPYVVITPTANREIDVTVKKVNKPADNMEFLAEYQYGTSLGGNENSIDLSTLPATKQFALYSRSAGGKTSYEEDVKGGTLQLMFQGEDEYWLKQEWNYFDRVNAKSSTKESELISRNSKFSMKGNSLKPLRYVVIYNSPGYPAELPGKALSDMYTFQYAGTPAGKTATISIRMNEAGEGTIFGWDGTAWQELETAIEDQVATSEGEILEGYIVVSK